MAGGEIWLGWHVWPSQASFVFALRIHFDRVKEASEAPEGIYIDGRGEGRTDEGKKDEERTLGKEKDGLS